MVEEVANAEGAVQARVLIADDQPDILEDWACCSETTATRSKQSVRLQRSGRRLGEANSTCS